MMKIAIPQWRHRVSPVLDESHELLIVHMETGKEVRRTKEKLMHDDPLHRARHISGLGVDVLICGAVSSILEIALISAGVQVISCKCGAINDVVDAYKNNKLKDSLFLMPGCVNSIVIQESDI
jgi:predicted Fe-Mo cluster-binding NifX family protein